MANFSEYEGKKNGPDIHPTPEGYMKLAKIMKHRLRRLTVACPRPH